MGIGDIPVVGQVYGTGKKLYNGLWGQASAPGATRYDQPDQERQLELRDQQLAYGALLRQQAMGRGASLYAPAIARAQRAGTAVAASARGANVALAGRTAAQTTGRLGMEGAELALKERLMSQQAYGALLAGARQQDLAARGQGVQLATGQLASDSAIASGNAQRGQTAVGAIVSMAGALGSDPAVKDNIAPVGSYQQPFQPQYGFTAPRNSYEAGLTNAGNVLGGGALYQPGAFSAQPAVGPPGGYGAPVQPIGSGVEMKTGIEPVGGVNPRFATLTSREMLGAGTAADAGTRPRPLTDAETRLRQWQMEQQNALAAQPGSGAYQDPTQIDLQLAQGRSGVMAGQQPGQPAAQQQSGWEQGLTNAGAILGGQSIVGMGKPGSDPTMKEHPLVVGAAQAQPYKFRYKPEFAAQEGTTTDDRYGAMATPGPQKLPGSLAENPVYAPTVMQGPDGLARVNGGQALMANVAVTSDMARKQIEDSQRLDALEQMVLKKAGGQGARGKQVDARDVIDNATARNEAAANEPPPGAVSTGQRYKALRDLSPGSTVPASYGADFGLDAPGGMRRGLVPGTARAPQTEWRALDTVRNSLGEAPRGVDQIVPNVRRQADLSAMAEAGKVPQKFFGGKPPKSLSEDEQAQVDLELETIMEQRIADAAHNINQGVKPQENYAALKEALETRANARQRRQDRLEQLHGFTPDAAPYHTAGDALIAEELRKRGTRRATPQKVKRQRGEVDL